MLMADPRRRSPAIDSSRRHHMTWTRLASQARRARRLLVVLAVTAGLTVAAAAPAQAVQWIVAQDGFEGYQGGGFWKFQRSGVGNGFIEFNSAYARTGVNN